MLLTVAIILNNSRQSLLEKAMAPHSSTVAWKIPWMDEPGRLQSMGLLRVRHDWELHFHFSLSCIGEGNGNPLQCSCLENPRDKGAWWAAVYERVRHDWSDLAAAGEKQWIKKLFRRSPQLQSSSKSSTKTTHPRKYASSAGSYMLWSWHQWTRQQQWLDNYTSDELMHECLTHLW